MVNRWGNNGSSDRLYFGGFKNHCRWRLNWLRLVIAFLPRRVDLQRKLSAKELMLLNCDVGEDSESPLDCKEIKPVNPNGNQFWIFIGRTDAEAEAPILRPPNARADSLEKTLILGKIESRRRRGMTEDKMVGWHHRLNWHEFEQAPGDGEGQGRLEHCSPWHCRVGHDWAAEEKRQNSFTRRWI